MKNLKKNISNFNNVEFVGSPDPDDLNEGSREFAKQQEISSREKIHKLIIKDINPILKETLIEIKRKLHDNGIDIMNVNESNKNIMKNVSNNIFTQVVNYAKQTCLIQ